MNNILIPEPMLSVFICAIFLWCLSLEIRNGD